MVYLLDFDLIDQLTMNYLIETDKLTNIPEYYHNNVSDTYSLEMNMYNNSWYI